VRGVKAQRIQVDEIWSFVGAETEERSGSEKERMGRHLDVTPSTPN